jgi:GH15 family glucan-1,4-alpha-glucosidase
MAESQPTRRHGRRFPVILAATVLLAAGLGVPASAAAASSPAPGAPGGPSSWTTGAKQGVGTATTDASKVWYTLAEGVLTEVYYPRVDVADVQDLQLIVTDGATFTELERDATTHRVELADPRALIYRQINTDKDQRYRITKTYVTDPARSTVLIDIRVDGLDGGTYSAYVLYNPSLANSGRHDSASSVGSALVAHDTAGQTDVASALVAKPAFSKVSSGFSGVSDGWTDLRADHRMDWTYASAADGNVVQVGQLASQGQGNSVKATLALGFAGTDSDALSTATASLRRAFPAMRDAYAEGWHGYLDSLAGAPAPESRDQRTQ